MRLLALMTDAFGGRGGIAKFNRDLLTALCTHPACTEVVALPRVVDEPPTALPPGLSFQTASASGKASWLAHAMHSALGRGFDAVICGHLNLLPAAAAVAAHQRVPLLLVVHGVEAWRAPRRPLVNRLLRRVDAVVSVSEVTRQRFLAWSGVAARRVTVIPNCVDAATYGAGPKRDDLLDRYGLRGRSVLLTVGRLCAAERYKGIDEVLAALPALAAELPTASYLVVGEGDDRARLQRRAAELGMADRVVFAGYVPEHEKADHYRLADVFVMPGRGEGFGIVYLEALACGVPIVASTVDASREAALDGELGELADPDDGDSIRAAVLRALRRERGVPKGLAHFSVPRFRERWHNTLDLALARAASGAASPLVSAASSINPRA